MAKDMVKEMIKFKEIEEMGQIDRKVIIKKHGHYDGKLGESSDFGSVRPLLTCINLLVDDGNKSRSNRKMLFKETYRKIGCGCSPHNTFQSVTVIMYATNFIAGAANKVKLVKNNKTTLGYGSGTGSGAGVGGGSVSGYNTRIEQREEPGYTKEIRTEQDVQTSGIPYRYVNNVDPNKDLITDTAKIGGPLKIVPAYDK